MTVLWEESGEFDIHSWRQCYGKSDSFYHQYAVVYPVQGGKFINVVAIMHDMSRKTWEGPWRTDVPQSELLEKYAGWDDEVEALMRVCFCSLANLSGRPADRHTLVYQRAHEMGITCTG